MKGKRKVSKEVSFQDDLPLIALKKQQSDSNMNMDYLFESSLIRCDFCDLVCNNRYENLVHTAKHIVIPLIRQPIYQCSKCMHVSAYPGHLLSHMMKAHRDSVEDLLKITSECVVEVEPMFCDMVLPKLKTPSSIKIEINKDNIIPLDNVTSRNKLTLMDNLISMHNVSMNDNLTPAVEKLFKQNETPIDSVLDHKWKEERECKEFNVKPEIGDIPAVDLPSLNSKLPMRSRIIFTDDEEPDAILPDSPVFFQHDNVSSQIMEPDTSQDIIPKIRFKKTEEINNTWEILSNLKSKTPVVPYDSLITNRLEQCVYCLKHFNNRYALIIHETQHLKLKRTKLSSSIFCPACEQYLNICQKEMDHHFVSRHPTASYHKMPKKFYKCSMCGLHYYHYKTHEQNFHKFPCQKCSSRFPSQNSLKLHKCQHMRASKQFWIICDICYTLTFLKNHSKYTHHTVVKEMNGIGVKHSCAKCGSLVSDAKLVETYVKRKPICQKAARGRHKKHISNEERLRNLQKRLQRLNLLHKYLVCFILQW